MFSVLLEEGRHNQCAWGASHTLNDWLCVCNWNIFSRIKATTLWASFSWTATQTPADIFLRSHVVRQQGWRHYFEAREVGLRRHDVEINVCVKKTPPKNRYYFREIAICLRVVWCVKRYSVLMKTCIIHTTNGYHFQGNVAEVAIGLVENGDQTTKDHPFQTLFPGLQSTVEVAVADWRKRKRLPVIVGFFQNQRLWKTLFSYHAAVWFSSNDGYRCSRTSSAKVMPT